MTYVTGHFRIHMLLNDRKVTTKPEESRHLHKIMMSMFSNEFLVNSSSDSKKSH